MTACKFEVKPIRAVIRDMILIHDDPAIRARLTLGNPMHEEALRHGRSTRGIDPEIVLYRKEGDGLLIPWGCRFWLGGEQVDQTETAPVEIPFLGELRGYQTKAIQALCETAGGVLVAATGAGKTISAIALCARLGQRTLILVKSLDLARQWIEAIRQFTGLDAGLIGGGKSVEGGAFTVALIQSLTRKPALTGFGCLVVDEAHNTPARQAFDLVCQSKARYRFGLSATPERRDGLEGMLFAALGPITARIDESDLDRAVLPAYVRRVHWPWSGCAGSWSEFIQVLSRDDSRNRMLAGKALKASAIAGTVMLAGTVEHCETLAGLCPGALLIHGQLPKAVRAARMADAPGARLIIGTLALLSEGIDLPHLTHLIFACPVSASVDRDTPAATRLIQSIGRVRRPYPDKKAAFVLDVVDDHPFGLNAAWKRTMIYDQRGFAWQDI